MKIKHKTFAFALKVVQILGDFLAKLHVAKHFDNPLITNELPTVPIHFLQAYTNFKIKHTGDICNEVDPTKTTLEVP